MLFNVVKHAHVSEANIYLDYRNGELSLSVVDNGIGFDPRHLNTAGSGFGLFSIKERIEFLGGHLQINSSPGKGSNIVVSIPVVLNFKKTGT
jgi:signal transduction histidine kinase